MNVRAAGSGVIDAYARVVAEVHIWRYLQLARLGVMTFQQASESVSATGGFVGYRIRQRFYQRLLAGCGAGLEMNRGATVGERGSRLGDRVWIGTGAYLDLVDVGDDVLVAAHACVLGGGRHHRIDLPDVPVRHQGNDPLRPTSLGSGSWVGANAVVMADVGAGSVIGAGAVVTKAVPPGAVAVGNPARVIRNRGDRP